MLMVVLTISGTGFLQHDFLEQRATTVEFDDHAALYFAQAGLERARVGYRFQKSNERIAWKNVLSETDPNYPKAKDGGCLTPGDPSSCLCPDLRYGCAIPRFQLPAGDPVQSPDIPIGGLFNPKTPGVGYSVRAFNDEEAEDPADDLNGILVVRSRGTVRGQEKLLETMIEASGLALINCYGELGEPCPDVGPSELYQIFFPKQIPPWMAGRRPRSYPIAPRLSVPLSDPGNYYRNTANFTARGMNVVNLTGPTRKIVLRPQPAGYNPTDCDVRDDCPLTGNTYYFIEGEVKIEAGTCDAAAASCASNVVVVAMKTVQIEQGVKLTGALIASNQAISIDSKSGDSLSNIQNLPLLISGGDILNCDHCELTGNLYAEGKIDLSGSKLLGTIIGLGNSDKDGKNVVIQGKMVVTDGSYGQFYMPMPGFDYPDGLEFVRVVPGSWRELR